MIAVSEHVRDDLVERLGYPRERVRVIHHGVDHERFRPDGRAREPFLLYPANWWPHKNHELLLEAFALVRRERPELRLVLTGAGHPAGLPDGVDVARPRVATSGSSTSTAAPPRSSSRACTRASGCRRWRRWRAAARSPSRGSAALPEVCGDAAVYFDPTSVEDIARGIDEVLDRPPARRHRAGRAVHLGGVRAPPRRRVP